jgi:hypothetical protein
MSKQKQQLNEASITKELKKNGKVTFDGPEVKQRKHFAPATKTDKPKKGKGSYNRKKAPEEAEQLPDPPSEIHVPEELFKKKKAKKVKNEVKNKVEIKEETNISTMIDNIMQKNYADAYKYLKDTISLKIQERISKEIDTPLFK